MKKPAIPKNEDFRLQQLLDYKVLDTEPEIVFDEITYIAATICQTPIALISLVDKERQWFKSRHGLTATETPREIAFCAHAIHDTKIFIVENADADTRFSDNPLVTGSPHVKFYAGAPLQTPSGVNIGTLCVIDNKANKLTQSQEKALNALANQVVIALELQKQSRIRKEQNLRFEEAEAVAKMGSWEFNLQTQELFWSKQQRIIFDLMDCPTDKLYEKYRARFVPEDLDLLDSAIQEAIAGSGSFSFEHRIKLANNETRWIHGVGKVVKDSDGRPVKMHGTGRDITEVKKLREELESQQLKTIQNTKMASLGEMASGIAHEINNPLSIIKGKVQLLRSKNKAPLSAEKIDEELMKIETVTERIAKIISGLRQFSRNSDSDPLQQTTVMSIVQDTLELCRNKIESNGTKILIEVSEDTSFYCRPVQISQVLLNLISNAFYAIEKQTNSWIKISASKDLNSVKIAVTDSGSGIPAEIASRMMEPFFTTRDVGKGTGLGLSISLGIAQQHRGDLVYKPKNGHTSFELTLPIAS